MTMPASPFYLSDGTTIRVVSQAGIISSLAVTSTDAVYLANGGFNDIRGLTQDGRGNLYAADGGQSGQAGGGASAVVAYKINLATLVVTRVAGIAGASVSATPDSGLGGLAASAGLRNLGHIVLDAAGNIYLGCFRHVLAINMQSTTQVLLGTSIAPGCIQKVVGSAVDAGNFSGDGGPANGAQLSGIGYGGLALDAQGNLFIADRLNFVVRRVDHATGIITSPVGTNAGGNSGDGAAASLAVIDPRGIAFDAAGNLYISNDFFTIRAVNMQAVSQTIFGQVIAPGNIQTVVGNGVFGALGDGGPALSAQLAQPYAMRFDVLGNLYIGTGSLSLAEVRMVTPAGIISAVAGGGASGNTGDGGLAVNALIRAVYCLSVGVPAGGTLSERNFACNGCFESSSAYGDVLKSLALSMAGFVVPPGDCWRVYAGSYVPPQVSLADGDCRAAIKGDFRLSTRDTCNGVKGQFIPAFLPINPLGPLASSPASPAWKKTDFPPVQRHNYIAEDGGVILWKEIQLDFTISLWMAQRIARIVLERLRRQVTISLPAKLTGLALLAADTMNFIHDRWNQVSPPVPTVFQISHTALRMESQADGVPAFGVDLMLRQTDAAVYTFAPPTSPTQFGDYSPYGQTGIGAGNVQ